MFLFSTSVSLETWRKVHAEKHDLDFERTGHMIKFKNYNKFNKANLYAVQTQTVLTTAFIHVFTVSAIVL